MSNLLEIKDLYGGYEQGIQILQGIDLTVAKGEVVGVIGLNGSGKSTFSKAVMNLVPYRKGSIVFNGQHVENKSTHELAQLGIALMHQGGLVFPTLSVWQNLGLAIGERSEKTYYDQLEGIIPLLRKPKKELMRIRADKLIGVQRHELALVMTLSRQPKLVIMDEPSAGLSPKAVEEMYGILRRIREHFGITIMLIEQNVTRTVGFCERCVVLEHGRIMDDFDENRLKMFEIESVMFNK